MERGKAGRQIPTRSGERIWPETGHTVRRLGEAAGLESSAAAMNPGGGLRAPWNQAQGDTGCCRCRLEVRVSS